MTKVKCEADCKFRGDDDLCMKNEIYIRVYPVYRYDELDEERTCDTYEPKD